MIKYYSLIKNPPQVVKYALTGLVLFSSLLVLFLIQNGYFFTPSHSTQITTEEGRKIEREDIDTGVYYVQTDSLPPQYHSELTITVAKLKDGTLRSNRTSENYDTIHSSVNHSLGESDLEALMKFSSSLRPQKKSWCGNGDTIQMLLIYEGGEKIKSYDSSCEARLVNTFKANAIINLVKKYVN